MVGWLFGWMVGWLVGRSQFPKKAGSYTTTLLFPWLLVPALLEVSDDVDEGDQGHQHGQDGHNCVYKENIFIFRVNTYFFYLSVV